MNITKLYYSKAGQNLSMDEKNVGALLVGSDLVHAGDLALSQHKDPHDGKFMPHRIAGFLLSFLDKVRG